MKDKKPKLPKKRSPVPPPGYVIDKSSYRRMQDKTALSRAVEEYQFQTTPRRTWLIILDGDDTLWSAAGGDVEVARSTLGGKTEERVFNRDGRATVLRHGTRETLRKLHADGMLIAVVSAADEEMLEALLEDFNLEGFVYWRYGDEPSVESLLKRIAVDMSSKLGGRWDPGGVVLVSRSQARLRDAKQRGIRAVHVGRDIENVSQLAGYIRRAGKSQS